MITRFPSNLQIPRSTSANAAANVMRDASPLSHPQLQLMTDVGQHEEDLSWVHWMFQSARIRHGSLIFLSRATRRKELLADWETFVRHVWLPHLAPILIQCWEAALENRDQTFVDAANLLNRELSEQLRGRSIESGRWLLVSTEGAKYQGLLGRLRQRVIQGEMEAHLPLIWAAIAALFQLPAPDLLMALLREEWRAGCPEHLPHSEPQGPASFAALAKVALRQSFKPRHIVG